MTYPTVGDLVKIMESVAEEPTFADDYVAQAIPALITIQGGECDEGPLIYLSWSVARIVSFALAQGGDGDTVRCALARTMKQTLPMPQHVYDAMVAAYAEMAEDAAELEIIAKMEEQFQGDL